MDFADIAEGAAIPSLTEEVTIVQTVMYCGITWDFARQHYDRDFARGLGFQNPVVDPQMYGAFLARMLTDWVSVDGRITKLRMRYRAAAFLGDILTYKGKIARKYRNEGRQYVVCDLTVENQKGEAIVAGEAELLFF